MFWLSLVAAVCGGGAARPWADSGAAPVVVWTAQGCRLPAGQGTAGVAVTAPAGEVIRAVLASGGVIGAARGQGMAEGGAEGVRWSLSNGELRARSEKGESVGGLTGAWGEPARGETASVRLEIDLNRLRAGGAAGEALFDAHWVQRALDRLAVNNARAVALRGALVAPGIDGLPPEAELRAAVSSRAIDPGAPARGVWLIRAGWQGTAAERAAVAGAAWVASVRADTQGLGVIGRSGGAGTWAGLIRLAVDVVGGMEAADGAAWDAAFARWQSGSYGALRSLNVRVAARGTLAWFDGDGGRGAVLIVPGRSGEKAEGLAAALREVAAVSRGWMTEERGVWQTRQGSVAPRLSGAVVSGKDGVFLVVSCEANEGAALLQKVAARLR